MEEKILVAWTRCQHPLQEVRTAQRESIKRILLQLTVVFCLPLTIVMNASIAVVGSLYRLTLVALTCLAQEFLPLFFDFVLCCRNCVIVVVIRGGGGGGTSSGVIWIGMTRLPIVRTFGSVTMKASGVGTRTCPCRFFGLLLP